MGLYKNNSGTLDPIAGTPDARLAQLDQLEIQLGNHTVAKDVPSNAVFTDTTTGDGLTTKVAKTGSGSTVTTTIPAGTTMDGAIGTLLNNDAALNNDLTNILKWDIVYILDGNTNSLNWDLTNYEEVLLVGTYNKRTSSINCPASLIRDNDGFYLYCGTTGASNSTSGINFSVYVTPSSIAKNYCFVDSDISRTNNVIYVYCR